MAAACALASLCFALTPPLKPVVPRPVVPRVDPRPFGDPLGVVAKADRSAVSAAADRSAVSTAAIGLAAALAAQPDAALAKGGEYGIFEGRIVSLAHPAIMATVYAASAWSAFSGWQWRSLREIGTTITEEKAKLKAVQSMVAAAEAKEEAPDAAHVAEAKALQAKIDELTATRKELAGSDWRAKHYQGAWHAHALMATLASLATAATVWPCGHATMRPRALLSRARACICACVQSARSCSASARPSRSRAR